VPARWTDGDDDARIDAVLWRRMARAVFQPIVRVETGLTVGYQGGLRGPLGSPLEQEDRLVAAAAYRGLAPQLDELRLQQTVEAAQRAKLAAPLALFVTRDIESSVAAPAVDSDSTFPIVVRFDLALPADAHGRLLDAAQRVRAAGGRVALAAAAPTPRLSTLLEAVAPEFVMLDARTFETDATAVATLLDTLEGTGITAIATNVDAEGEARRVEAAGVAFAYGLRFGRRDLLVRAPVIFDPAGFDRDTTEVRDASTTAEWSGR
jgi:EAL domain-containing protein (putative c-di-GMP-specific phosphodiesterase class I)